MRPDPKRCEPVTEAQILGVDESPELPAFVAVEPL